MLKITPSRITNVEKILLGPFHVISYKPVPPAPISPCYNNTCIHISGIQCLNLIAQNQQGNLIDSKYATV